MTAVVQDAYGEAGDVLRVEHVPLPEIGDDEVLLRVHAVGVDRGVWHLMAGQPYPVRLAFGMRAPKERVRGREVAGRVEAIGRDVTDLRPGDEVFGLGEGCFAEYARARPDRLAPRPAGVSTVAAAATTASALTALQAVRDHGRVQPGQKALVIGASGGVGTFAVQIAKVSGAEVTGVCRTSKVDLVRTLGADHIVDHTRDAITGRYDVVVDNGGHRSLTVLRRLLTPRGRLVLVGSETGGRWLGGLDRSLRAMLISPFVGQTLGSFVSPENTADLVALAELVESGQVVPAVERTFALPETAAAIQHMVDGHVRGKVVVTV